MKYTIKKGDTLSEIAYKYGVSTDVLAKVNGIKNVDRIMAGDNIFIPQNMEPPRFVSQEPQETNLALSPIGSPARQPVDPMRDAIQPSGFFGGDPLSEILAAGSLLKLGVGGYEMGKAATQLGKGDLSSLSKYLTPEQMRMLLTRSSGGAAPKPALIPSGSPTLPHQIPASRGINHWAGQSRNLPDISKLKSKSYMGKPRTIDDLHAMLFGGGR